MKNCKFRIMLIDDNEHNVQLLRGLLSQSGYEISSAGSGASYVAQIKRFKPDIIIIDMGLDKTKNCDICSRLKSDDVVSKVPVIFITEVRDSDELVACFNAGAVDYIVKPFVKDELLARVRVHAELFRKNLQEEMLSSMLDKYALQIVFELDGTIVYSSTAFNKLGGYDEDELVGKHFDELKHKDSFRSVLPDIVDSVQNKFNYYKEIDLRKKSGDLIVVNTNIEPIVMYGGGVAGALCFMTDITSRKQLEVLSVTDKLTGLNNRQKLDQILAYEHSQQQRYKSVFSVILVDIDNFKHVNDTFGHVMGDKVLINFAKYIKTNVRSSDTAGRWGGEEFLIILPKATEEEAFTVAEKLRKTVEASDMGVKSKITFSAGISIMSENVGINKLISNADKALYQAKRTGKNKVVKFSEIQ